MPATVEDHNTLLAARVVSDIVRDAHGMADMVAIFVFGENDQVLRTGLPKAGRP